MGNVPEDGKPISLNGNAFIVCRILKFIVSSAAEAEIAGLFMNAKMALPIRQALIEMGHPQPPTKIKTDNSTADGFVNNKIKQNRSKAIDMRFYWLKCRQQQQQFEIYWEAGKTNFADYFTKHHSPTHHRAVRPIYLYEENVGQMDLRGCAKILIDRARPRATKTKMLSQTKTLLSTIETWTSTTGISM